MRIDPLDNTLVCQKDDLQKLHFHQDDCILPAEIELGLLKIACGSVGIEPYDGDSATEACEHLPKWFLNRIVAQINGFFLNSGVNYAGKHLSYLLYYFPVNVYKVWKPMTDLLAGNVLKRNLHILDVGTGPGSVPVGIIEFYGRLAESYPGIEFSLDFALLDRQKEFLALAEKTSSMACEHVPRNLCVIVREYLHQQIATETCSRLNKDFDIFTLSNMLTANEGAMKPLQSNLCRRWRDAWNQMARSSSLNRAIKRMGLI